MEPTSVRARHPVLAAGSDGAILAWHEYGAPGRVAWVLLDQELQPGEQNWIQLAGFRLNESMAPAVVATSDRFLLSFGNFVEGVRQIQTQPLSAQGIAVGNRATVSEGGANSQFPRFVPGSQAPALIWMERTDPPGLVWRGLNSEGGPVGDLFRLDEAGEINFKPHAVAAVAGRGVAWVRSTGPAQQSEAVSLSMLDPGAQRLCFEE